MLAGSGDELFLYGRLNEPLGYVNGQSGYLLLGVWPLIALAERARQAARRRVRAWPAPPSSARWCCSARPGR